jgi:ABC-type Zn uptake system ZnuABC Zn-binding protein ZnuA
LGLIDLQKYLGEPIADRLVEFPKQAEKFLSDYQEAQRELERTQARARSQLAQAKAKLTSADATLSLQ